MNLLMPLVDVILQQGRTLPDTVVTRLVPAPATGIQQFAAVMGTLAILLPYLFFGAAVWVGIRIHRAFEATRVSLDEVGKNLKELTENANRIASDVATVADSVRSSVSSVRETVDYANRRAHHAVTVLADRVDDFNDALGVAQEDTQKLIVTAVAALKGVRAGVSAFRKRRRPTAEPIEDDLDDDEDIEFEDEVEDETPPDLPVRPRLRRRARGER